MSELYIEPEKLQRNPITGRFSKGSIPHNKGRSMKYHSKKSKTRSIRNLANGRGAHHRTGAGMNKKSVVVIKNRKLIAVYKSVNDAGCKIGITPSHISAVCLKKKGHKTVRGYKVYFESDNEWLDEIDY